MREVLGWVADPDAAAGEVQRLLRRSPEPAFEPDARQFLQTNDRTRSSICATIMPALGWLTDPIAAAAAGQTVGRQVLLDESGVTVTDGRDDEYRAAGLDVGQLLAQRRHGVPARRAGRPGRPAGHRAHRTRRPDRPADRGQHAVRPAGSAAHPGAGRGGVDLPDPAG